MFSFIYSCNEDPELETVELDETPYNLEYGLLPTPRLPLDNPLTVQGVLLGKMLFYEKQLSGDNSQSCADCHRQETGFSDPLRFSVGVRGLEGDRQAMPVFNMAWHQNEFFWDGRAHLLRDQSIEPIQNPIEMDESLDNVISKLEASKNYRDQFIRAFGSPEITTARMALAMEQFMMSIVSADSKYDKFLAGEVQLTESEERGRILFETEYNPFFPESSGGDCTHCHGGLNFENDQYMNNGLDSESNQTDKGRELVTQDLTDRAKFKVPSLRNIAVTAPYMHDGRFQTLEEVIEHYNSGIKDSPTVSEHVGQTIGKGLFLSEQDKIDLINFLKTLTDYSFLENDEYKSPFE